MEDQEVLRLKAQKLRLMEEQLRKKEGLPHLYGLKKYPWQVKYKKNKKNPRRFICAANQIGKSTIQIEDRIDVATRPDLWPKLWPTVFKYNPHSKPFSWYLYPNQDTVMTEFTEKWEPYYLPRGEYKDHPVYGWKKVITNKVLKHIEFNSGWKIYFKTYNQNVQDLQSSSPFAIDCDEELPEHLWDEITARLFATDGYFSMVFTATLGQQIWYDTIMEKGTDRERFKDAFKLQVSMYDCLKYSDGSETPWTKERIALKEASCKNDAEVRRRIYGEFAVDTGLKYTGFDRKRNYKPFPRTASGGKFKGVPKGWNVYSAIDIGSGGDNNHPAAYIFLMVNPEFTKIRALKMRRLDGIETTVPDIWEFYKRSRGKIQPVYQAYDWAAKDFGTMVSRMGEPFEKAKKDHDLGELALNAALKTGTFVIYYDEEDNEDESFKLVRELETSLVGENKRTAKDDLIDACRYAIMGIPIDWEALLMSGELKADKKIKEEKHPANRRGIWESEHDRKEDQNQIESELEEWADLY